MPLYTQNVYLREVVFFIMGAGVFYTLMVVGPPGGILSLAWGASLLISSAFFLHSFASIAEQLRLRGRKFHQREVSVLTEELIGRLSQLDVPRSSLFRPRYEDIPVDDNDTTLGVVRTAYSYYCFIETSEVIDYDTDNDVTVVRYEEWSYTLPLGALQGPPKASFKEWIEEEDDDDDTEVSEPGFIKGFREGFTRWHTATPSDLWVLYDHLRESSYQT